MAPPGPFAPAVNGRRRPQRHRTSPRAVSQLQLRKPIADPRAAPGAETTIAGTLPRLLTADETADLLRTIRKAVYALAERGQLSGVTRIGRRLLVRRDVLLDWARSEVRAIAEGGKVMSVTVGPYRQGGWEVDVRVVLQDATRRRDRRRAPVSSKSAAELSPRTFCTFGREFSPFRQQEPTDEAATLISDIVRPVYSGRPRCPILAAVASRRTRSAPSEGGLARSGQAAASLDGHVSQNADRFASRRDRRAAFARDARSAGTASPVPRYISSGVCPRNAECGSTQLCSWT